MDYFGKQLERTNKTNAADFRTQADVAAEEILISAIEKNLPEYNIVAEEHGTMDKGSPYSFIIDPLDGTNNFVLGIQRSLDLWAPGFCFCGLACGRLEAVINDGTELYDYAAGRLIALEAGGRTSDFQGKPEVLDDNDTFMLTNGSSIHEFLVDNLTHSFS